MIKLLKGQRERDWRGGTVCRTLALLTADLGLIPGVLYAPQSIAR